MALACAYPELCCEIYDSAQAGDIARAQELQKLLAAPSALLGAKYGISGLKYSLDRLGYFGGPVRGPLLPLDEAGKREIDAMLAAMNSAAVPLGAAVARGACKPVPR